MRGSRGFGFSRVVRCSYFGCDRRVFGIHWRNFGDAVEQGIDARAHFGFVAPLLVKSLFQNVDGFEAEIDDLRKWIDLALAEAADQIFNAVSDTAETLETYLRGGALYCVYRAEEFVDFLRTMIRFKREQAITDNLQMLLGFGLEEFENFGWDFVVFRQSVEIGAGNRGHVPRIVRWLFKSLLWWLIVERRGFRRECKAVALLERSDVVEYFLARVADFEKIGLK